MELITLVENTTFSENLKAEHGLSFLIKTKDIKILFDTGSTGILIDNLLKLNENLDNLDFIILSHGHYDHTGGLERTLEYIKENNFKVPKLILKKEALLFKYKLVKNKMIDKGFALRKDIQNIHNKITFIDKYHKLSNNIYIMGNIKKFNDFEGKNPGYYTYNDLKTSIGFSKKGKIDYLSQTNFSNLNTKNRGDIENNKNNMENIIKNSSSDNFKDELFLIIKDDKNEALNIITGCSHNGIINIVKTAINFFKIKKINLIAGGFHLKSKDQYYILNVINEFKKIDFNIIGINHCSGFEAYRLFKNEFNEKVKYISTGDRIKF